MNSYGSEKKKQKTLLYTEDGCPLWQLTVNPVRVNKEKNSNAQPAELAKMVI